MSERDTRSPYAKSFENISSPKAPISEGGDMHTPSKDTDDLIPKMREEWRKVEEEIVHLRDVSNMTYEEILQHYCSEYLRLSEEHVRLLERDNWDAAERVELEAKMEHARKGISAVDDAGSDTEHPTKISQLKEVNQILIDRARERALQKKEKDSPQKKETWLDLEN